MKKILVLALCLVGLVVTDANAQIASKAKQNEMFVEVSHHSSNMFPTYNVIYVRGGYYIIRFASTNEFEDKYIVFQLGNGKAEAVNTMKELVNVMENVTKKNPAYIEDTAGHELTINKNMGYIMLEQKGIAGTTRALTIKHISKAIDDIENFDESLLSK